MRPAVLPTLCAVPFVLAAQSGPVVHRGSLGSGDPKLRSGEFCDTYTIEGRAGQRIVFDLQSTAFDPFLMVVSHPTTRKRTTTTGARTAAR